MLLVAALLVSGMSELILLAAPCLVAGIVLLALAYARRGKRTSQRKAIVIDGSNAMHWKDGSPQIATLREIVQHIRDLGFTPGVVFDANAGYLLTGRYQNNAAMGRLLGLPDDHVIVVPKGSPADPTILSAARFLDARIVTNDRYRDWVGDHPELGDAGYLIRGGYRAGKLWLDVEKNEG